MEIYLDLDNTLLNNEKTLNREGMHILKKLSEQNKIIILTTGALAEAKQLFSIPNLEIVSTLENKIYKNNSYQFLPLECNLKDFLTSSFVYTLYGVHEDTTYIMKYQERMKNFYPTSNLQICDSFPSTIASFVVAIFKEGINWALDLLKDYQIVTLASDSKKTLLLVSKTISTKEAWILKLKESPAIAIGDSYTDYDFIKHCEVQVAMKNGENELKAVCQFQTEKSNQENGALDFILNFLKHQQA